MTIRVAGYARISQDSSGERWGVETQRKRIAALAEARDWDVVGWYEDNDLSASKPRGPKSHWAKLLADAKIGLFDTVVAVDVDRLLRSTRDMNTLIDLGLNIVTVDGEIDVSTADGELRASFLAMMARFETRRKSERQLRSNERRRAEGLPVLSGKKPFGYDGTGVQIPEQVEAVRSAFDAFLGDPPLSIARIAADLNDAGHRTTRGTAWSTAAVRHLLNNPLYAGFIRYYATDELFPVAADGDKWVPVVSEATWRAATAKLERNRAKRTDRGNQRRYLLSGVAVCGRCGGRMAASMNASKLGTYKCLSCFLSRQREPIDAMVGAAIVTRLSAPDALDLFATPISPDLDARALRSERVLLTTRADELASLLSDPVVPIGSTRAALAEVRSKLDAIDAQLMQPSASPALDLAQAVDVAAAWAALDVDRQRLIVEAVVEVTVQPVPNGNRRFDPALIEIVAKT